MDGQARELMWIFDVRKIEVPFFQRPYVWDEENFDSLIDSFLDAPDNTMPFFGSIIFKEMQGDDQGNDWKEYLIIDGQQRITTFSILIRVLLDINIINPYNLSPTVILKLRGFVYNIELDDDGNENDVLKIIPSRADRNRFIGIMDPEIDRTTVINGLKESPLDDAYRFFYNYFSDDHNKGMAKKFCLKLINTGKSLIFIILDNKDDEQKIFDSVNSMGKSLSNSDIIKNYLYQKMKEVAGDDTVKIDKVMKHYYSNWDDVFYKDENKKSFWYEEFTVGRILTDYLENFLKDFAIIKKIYTAKKTTGVYGLCKAYKDYIDKLSMSDNPLDSIMAFATEIKEYAEVFYQYKTEYRDLDRFVWSDYQNRLLLILDRLETSTFNPYILKLLKESPSNIQNRFFNVEKFLLFRFIYEGTTKNYNQCCEGLLNASDDLKYLSDYMKESPTGSSTYKSKFRKLTNRQGLLFMFLLEMLKRNGEEDKYSDLLTIGTYTLEHVMPQKWNKNNDWLKLPSYDESGNAVDKNDTQLFMENREQAVKSLGNFALLTSKLNTAISNSDFNTKVNGKTNAKGKTKDGMRKYASALYYTKAIINLCDSGEVWDERRIYKNEKEYFDLLNDYYSFE